MYKSRGKHIQITNTKVYYSIFTAIGPIKHKASSGFQTDKEVFLQSHLIQPSWHTILKRRCSIERSRHFMFFFCRSEQHSSEKSSSLIARSAIGASEDLRVAAAMWRGCVFMYVHIQASGGKTFSKHKEQLWHVFWRASTYLYLEQSSSHIYWAVLWTGGDTRTRAGDDPLSWWSIPAARLKDLRHRHHAEQTHTDTRAHTIPVVIP